MKVENNRENIETEDLVGENEVIEAGIDQKNLGFLFDIVSSQMYSNPIGSLIREITSNCFDSHAEAGIVEPIRVAMTHDLDSGYTMEFEDFGVGIGPKRMKKIYSKYFSSTKRDTNDQIGMFGLGSKSPLAYCDAFKIRTRFEGVEYLYLVRKGAEKPVIELIYDKPTTERNGSCVMVPVKNEDVHRFKSETRSQLSLFRDIIFYNLGIDNDYFIIETDTFKYRPDFQFSPYIHLCIGDVSYPIDYDAIGIRAIELPIAIKFEIGEISVNPQREAIRYLDGVKEKILAKIATSIREILIYYNKKVNTYPTFADYTYRKKRRRNVSFYSLTLYTNPETGAEYSINVAGLIEAIEEKEPFYKDFKTNTQVFKPLSDIDVVISDHDFISHFLLIKNEATDTLKSGKSSYYPRRAEGIFSSYSDIADYFSLPKGDAYYFTPNVVINRTSENASTIKDEYLEDCYKRNHRIYSVAEHHDLYNFSELKRNARFPQSGYKNISNIYRRLKLIEVFKDWLESISIDYAKLQVPKFWIIQRDERIREAKRLKKEQEKLKVDVDVLNFTDRFEYVNVIPEIKGDLDNLLVTSHSYLPTTAATSSIDTLLPTGLLIGPTGSISYPELSVFGSALDINPMYLKKVDECTPNRDKIHPNFLNAYPGTIIYGYKEDYDRLASAARWLNLVYGKFDHIKKAVANFRTAPIYQVYQVSQKNKKHFKALPNAIHVSKFYSMENPLFEKIACSLKLKESGVMDYINRVNPVYRLQDLNRELYSSVHYLCKFERTYDSYHYDSLSKQMAKEVRDVINFLNIGNTLFDYHLKKVSDYFEGLEILKFVNFEEEQAFNLAIQLAKEKKKKVNFYHYLSVPFKIKLFLRTFYSVNYYSKHRGLPNAISDYDFDRWKDQIRYFRVSQLQGKEMEQNIKTRNLNIDHVYVEYFNDFKIRVANFKEPDQVEELTEEQTPISVENVVGIQVCEPTIQEESRTNEIIHL